MKIFWLFLIALMLVPNVQALAAATEPAPAASSTEPAATSYSS